MPKEDWARKQGTVGQNATFRNRDGRCHEKSNLAPQTGERASQTSIFETTENPRSTVEQPQTRLTKLERLSIPEKVQATTK